MNERELATKKRLEEAVVKGNLYYPDESVIRFLMKYRKDLEKGTFMDFGCGAGRHAIAASKAGYSVWAVDYNEGGLRLGKEREEQEKELFGLQPIQWVKTPENEGLLKDNSFDRILAWGALYTCENLEKVCWLLKGLRDKLKPGGLIYADFRNKEDGRYGQGEKIDDNFFVLHTSEDHDGLLYYFAEKEQLQELYAAAGLKIIEINEHRFTYENETVMNNFYQVLAQKE